jgi:hypothetical protein
VNLFRKPDVLRALSRRCWDRAPCWSEDRRLSRPTLSPMTGRLTHELETHLSVLFGRISRIKKTIRIFQLRGTVPSRVVIGQLELQGIPRGSFSDSSVATAPLPDTLERMNDETGRRHLAVIEPDAAGEEPDLDWSAEGIDATVDLDPHSGLPTLLHEAPQD